uniref:Uncharacterized protein n=1 Tax=Romanomermis culicivorax TaxID=13658 RepID=A0A915L2N4_ROMCU
MRKEMRIYTYRQLSTIMEQNSSYQTKKIKTGEAKHEYQKQLF